MKFIRCIALLAGIFLVSSCSVRNAIVQDGIPEDMILAKIDGQALTVQEFEREYAKTVGTDVASRHSQEEYADFLRRYINFLVKLKEAEGAGYFEDEDLISEIDGYRASFAKPYLLDKEVVEPIVKDLYEKRKDYVHASHIMVNLPRRENPAPGDTLRAWKKISALQDSLQQGVPFGDLAFRQSEDRAAGNSSSTVGYRGDLGFFTGGSMIRSFENAAYNTPKGQVSGIVRSAYGYHIIKVHDREETKPDYLPSHIMVFVQGETAADSARAYAKIDSLKTLINEGASFAEVAREYSEHEASAQHGGSLQSSIPYRTGQLDQTFHDSLFAMDTPGQVSGIVKTPFGLHLIKLDDIAPEKTYDEQYDNLERLAQSLPRIRTAEAALTDSLRELYTSSVDTTLLTRLIGGIETDSLQSYLQLLAETESASSMQLITLQDSVYTVRDFANFVQTQQNPLYPGLSSTENSLGYADAFLDDKVLLHRSFELENTDEDFKEIMQNFRDGLAIFAIMEDSVWNASSEDTLRLMQHYEANIEQYQWPDRYRLIEISGLSDSLLTGAIHMVEEKGTWTDLEYKIASDSTWNLQLDTVIVADSTGSIYDKALKLKTGEHTEILSARSRKLVLYMDGIEPARPKTFEEARTDVMAEIQVLLEENLHQRLRKKYRVQTFTERLETVFRQ